jgi:signal transduction histidine kinase/DNA-binding response OmpR family regulator
VTDLRTGTGPIQRLKEERARRLNAVEIPILRCIGSAFIAVGVFINNYVLLGTSSATPALTVLVILAVYCAISWAALAIWYGSVGVDLALVFLALDLPLWTVAIYFSGAEHSWLFFILFMRVADQTQTTFARCFGFAACAAFCYAAMLVWVVVVDHRPLLTGAAAVKLIFIFFGGLYIALSARGSERRRTNLSNAVRMARELVRKLELQSAELREARGRAEQASAAKSEFLANMSHEMRTPLHGILGMLQLLIESETLPERVRQLEMARRAAESLLATIGDILDFSKIEARKLDLEPVYFSLRELVTDTIKALGITAAERNLALALSVAPDVPDRVWSDPLRLRQVIVNLVGNAIKFTNAGEIVVRVTCGAVDEEQATIDFAVRDTGIGIDQRKQEIIFTPFAQGDTSHSRRYGGTGLGLAIVSRVIEAMAGTISVESEPGKGSTFRFSMTFACEPVAASTVPEWEGRLAGARILLIEPEATSRGIVADILRAHGIDCDAYATLADAGTGPLHQTYDCIVADAPIVGAMIPLVRLASPLSTSPEVGVTVTRPVGERELIDAIGIAMGLTERGMTFTLERRTGGEGMLHVLVVDDHAVNLEFAIEALRRLGHRVTPAGNGDEALWLLGRQKFDLVLLDVQMPGIDGLEVARRFRAAEQPPRTPIVALTAHTTPVMRERCLAAGFDSVLAKPVSQPALAAILRGAEPPPLPEDDFVTAVGGNMKLLARVRDAFVEQTPRLLQGIRDAIGVRDGKSIYEKAHTLKGAVSNFGVAETVQAAAEIERAGKEEAIERAAELLPLLEAKLRDLEMRLDSILSEAKDLRLDWRRSAH